MVIRPVPATALDLRSATRKLIAEPQVELLAKPEPGDKLLAMRTRNRLLKPAGTALKLGVGALAAAGTGLAAQLATTALCGLGPGLAAGSVAGALLAIPTFLLTAKKSQKAATIAVGVAFGAGLLAGAGVGGYLGWQFVAGHAHGFADQVGCFLGALLMPDLQDPRLPDLERRLKASEEAYAKQQEAIARGELVIPPAPHPEPERTAIETIGDMVLIGGVRLPLFRARGRRPES